MIPANTLHTLRKVGPDRLCQLAILDEASPGTTWLEPEGSVAKMAPTWTGAGHFRSFANDRFGVRRCEDIAG